MTTKTRYIPPESTEIKDPSSEATVYTHNRNGVPCAIGYKSEKTVKPDFNYRFRNETERAAYVAKFFVECSVREKNRQAHREAQKAKKADFTNPLFTGDFLYSSWGYDQTNVEFYQVVSTTPKTVTFREVRSTQHSDGNGYNSMSGSVTPCPNEWYDAKVWTRPIKPGHNNSVIVPFADYPGGYMKHLYKWDGTPKHNSWYA